MPVGKRAQASLPEVLAHRVVSGQEWDDDNEQTNGGQHRRRDVHRDAQPMSPPRSWCLDARRRAEERCRRVWVAHDSRTRGSSTAVNRSTTMFTTTKITATMTTAA